MGNVTQPGPSDRTLIAGRTGSGKTVAGIYHLSNQNYTDMPWIIWDFKRDKAIQTIDYVALDVESSLPPTRPGIYVLSPLPDQKEAIEQFLWRCWEQENIGQYVDEGYMIAPSKEGRSKAFRAILTQGRSKRIPVIINTQRPVDIDRFAISEADYFQIFHLNDERDRKTVQSFVNKGLVNLDKQLERYHSYYYDIKEDAAVKLGPVPMAEDSISYINSRLRQMRNQTAGKIRHI